MTLKGYLSIALNHKPPGCTPYISELGIRLGLGYFLVRTGVTAVVERERLPEEAVVLPDEAAVLPEEAVVLPEEVAVLPEEVLPTEEEAPRS